MSAARGLRASEFSHRTAVFEDLYDRKRLDVTRSVVAIMRSRKQGAKQAAIPTSESVMLPK